VSCSRATLHLHLISNGSEGYMRRIQRITEHEVIAEFLKSEFYHQEFVSYRRSFEHLVFQGDVTDTNENALRHALLYRRRGHMLQELPVDTEWWEVQVELSDMKSIRVIPRAQWRRVASGSFLLCEVAERIRTQHFTGSARECAKKVHAISLSLRRRENLGCVLLIGIDESNAFTILDGNHRLTSALLECSSVPKDQLRVVCGFSPRMYECCWYETNIPNLWHYAKNRIRSLFSKEADIQCIKNHRSSTAGCERESLEYGVSSKPLLTIPVTRNSCGRPSQMNTNSSISMSTLSSEAETQAESHLAICRACNRKHGN